MGTITYIIHLTPEKDGIRNTQEYVIIDGQQRITTTMFLLKAMQQKSRDERTKSEITRILSNDSTDNPDRLRLKPIKRDREAFTCVVEGHWNEYSGDSKIKTNYHLFIKELDKYMEQGYTIEEIYSAFLRLKIVGIGLEKGDDDPQIVFESINATGVKLEGIDLIRNFLMMGENFETQEKLYNKYWTPMEEYLTKESVQKEFIEHYLRMYYGEAVKKDKIYDFFKRHRKENFDDNTEGLESLMKDLSDYAKIYRVFIDDASTLIQTNASEQELAKLKRRIKEIVALKFGVARPFIMRLAHDYERDRLSFDDFSGMLETLISYYVRRMICGEASNALNKLMYGLYQDLDDEKSINLNGLRMFLGKKSGREIFPSNEQIKNVFGNCNAYSMRTCKYILLEIERLITAEPPEADKLEIEHFYPQTPRQEWRDLVGDQYAELESLYLHTFGNLTLTGQNTSLGNKPFEEKIDLLLEKGSLKLNEYFTNASWGIEEIQDRSKYLADKFCEVPVFRDLPKEYRTKAIFKTLNDDLTFHKFSFIKFPNGEEQTIHNAKTLVKAIIDYMYNHYKEAVEDALDEAPRYITFDEDKAKNKDGNGFLSVWCENGRFYFISSSSMRDIGSNLSKFVSSARVNPEKFILR